MKTTIIVLVVMTVATAAVMQEPPTLKKLEDLDQKKAQMEKIEEMKRMMEEELIKEKGLRKQQEAERETLVKSVVEYVDEFKSLQKKGLIDCDLCHNIFTRAWNKDNLKKVLAATLKVCDGAIDADKEKCSLFVKKYGPDAVNYLRFTVNSADFCDALQLCTQESWAAAVTKDDHSAKCEGCKFGVSVLDSMLQSTTVQTSLTKLLVDNVCGAIQDQEGSSECEYLVNEYAPAVLNSLGDILGTELLCVETGACKE